MAVYLSPVGANVAPAANELRLLAVFKEKLCKSYCIDSTIQPQTILSYRNGTPRLVGTTIFVVTPNGCCNATTQIFTETFVVAFQGYSSLPTSVTVNQLGRDIQPSCVKCGCAHGVTVNDSIQVIITATAVAEQEV